jgi:hypothetical protein
LTTKPSPRCRRLPMSDTDDSEQLADERVDRGHRDQEDA